MSNISKSKSNVAVNEIKATRFSCISATALLATAGFIINKFYLNKYFLIF